jgi:hypothetical protein
VSKCSLPFRRRYDKAQITDRWDSEGVGVKTHLAKVEFSDHTKGMYFAARALNNPSGIIVLEIDHTNAGGVTLECDLPRQGCIILPSNVASIYARIDAPYPGALVSVNPQKVDIAFEIGKTYRTEHNDNRRTIVANDPNGAGTVDLDVPFGAKRFNVLSTASVNNVGRLDALTENGTILASYFAAFTSGAGTGSSGFELPPQVVKIRMTGGGGAASGFQTFVFHLSY